MSYLDRTDTFIASLGLEAYRVGGSVRDEILGRRVKDADYVICAPLNEITRRFHAVKHTVKDPKITPLVLRDGRQAGWRIAARGLGCIEIVLPRTERSTGPGHRDFEIVLDHNLPLSEDAKRRDFTFNALYKMVGLPDGCCDDCEGVGDVLDPTGRGLNDLKRQRINVTHGDSFRDDPLRILRALRFMSQLGYEMGRETYALMMLHAEHVSGLTSKGYVSGTVLDEFSKMLMGQDPGGALRVARDTGVLATVMPELAAMLGFDQGSRYHDMTTDEHTFTALDTAAHVDAPLRVRWALLFHDSGKPQTAWVGPDGRKHYYAQSDKPLAELVDVGDGRYYNLDHEVMGAIIWRQAAKVLGADKRLRDDVNTLIENHMVPCRKVNPVKVRRARVKFGDDLLRDLYLMRLCDLSGKGDKNQHFLLNVSAMERERAAAQAAGVPSTARDLAINGHDVKALVSDGREVGRVLAAVLDEVVVDPAPRKLTRDWQLERARAAAHG